jgi:hypothetical protein
VLRSPLTVTPRGGLTSLSSTRRSLVVSRVGSDPGVPSQGSRYNTTGGSGSGGSSGRGGGSGGSGGSGGEPAVPAASGCIAHVLLWWLS